MKLSTNAFYDRTINQLSNGHKSVADLQAKLATGKEVLRPSDAPEKSAMILRIKSALEQQNSFERNLNSVLDRMSGEEIVMQASSDLMQRVITLGVQASNVTLAPESRELVALEIASIRDELLQLANHKDANGHYTFAGSKIDTQPFVDDGTGTIAYAGDSSRVTVNVSEFREITIKKPGNEVFTAVIRDDGGVDTRKSFFAVLDDFEAAILSNDSDAISTGFAEVKSINEGLARSLTDIGSRIASVENQREIIEDTKVRYQTLLSQEEDLDYTTAVTQLSQEMLALESAQASFAKIAQLSLFNYLR